MPEISFALILNENLKNKHLKVKQVESVIEVKGKLDPYQLQKIRDHVSDSFQARRKLINDLIAGKAKEAAKIKDPKKQKQLIIDVDTAIAKSAAAFDKKVQASITTFCEKDIELQAAAESGKWSYWVKTAWTVGCVVWDGVEVAKDAGEAYASGGAGALAVLKGMFDLCLSLEKLCTEQRDAWRGVDEQEKRLQAALDAIRKVKKGSPIGQSLIDKAESALLPLGPKIDTMERTARKIAGTLDDLLKQQSAKALKGRKEAAKLEKLIQSGVEEVATIGAGIAAKRKAQSSAKDSIKSALTKAKTDTATFMGWVLDYYGKLNDAIDKFELSKGCEDLSKLAKDLKTTINVAIDEAEDD